jgi:hypothetical protein
VFPLQISWDWTCSTDIDDATSSQRFSRTTIVQRHQQRINNTHACPQAPPQLHNGCREIPNISLAGKVTTTLPRDTSSYSNGFTATDTTCLDAELVKWPPYLFLSPDSPGIQVDTYTIIGRGLLPSCRCPDTNMESVFVRVSGSKHAKRDMTGSTGTSIYRCQHCSNGRAN